MRLLLIHPRSAGDVLRTTPALAALRRRFPDARIGFAVEARFAPLLDGNPDIDSVVPIPDALSDAFTRTPPRPAEPALPPDLAPLLDDLRARLRAFAADRVVNVSAGPEGCWVVRLAGRSGPAGAPGAIGYRFDDSTGATVFAGESEAHAALCLRRRGHVNRVRFYLHVVGAPDDADDRPRVVVTDAGRAEAAALLGDDPRPVCVVQPGAGDETRVWEIKRTPPEELAALAARIEADGHRIVFVGSAAERERASIVGASCRDALDLVGRTTLPGLAAVLERAALYVGHDSGPSHVACALGRPALVVFFATAPLINAPVGGPSLLVQADLEGLFHCRGGIEDYAEALRRTRAPVLLEAVLALRLLAAGADRDVEGLREAARRLARVRRAGLAAWRDGRIGRPVIEPDLEALGAAGAAAGSVAGAALAYLREVAGRFERAEGAGGADA